MYNTNKKAVLFDMDGVVIDSEKLYSTSEKGLLSNYGVKFDDSDWHYIKGCTEKQFYDLVYRKYNPDIDRDLLISQGREFLKKVFTQKLEYMDGFIDIHSNLKNKFKLALVTSTGPELVNHIESLLSIYSKFDLVITSLDTSRHKPLPDPYNKAMEKLNLKPYECVVVEDSIQGIKAGKNAGCPVIALEGSIEREHLKEADYIISHLSDIQNIL